MAYINNLGPSPVSPSLITNKFKEPTAQKKEDVKPAAKNEFNKTLNQVNKLQNKEIQSKTDKNPNQIKSNIININNGLNSDKEILKNNQIKNGTDFALNKSNEEDELIKLSQEFEKTFVKLLWSHIFTANEINNPKPEGGLGEKMWKTELVNEWVEGSYKPGHLAEQVYRRLKNSNKDKVE